MPRKTQINHGLTTPEMLEKVNPDNKQLAADFLDYLRSLKRSPGTIHGYENDLNIFFCWLLNNADNKAFEKVTKRELVRFQNWMGDNGNSPSRIRRVKACISSLSNYIENILDTEDQYRDFRSVVRKIESPALQPVRDKTVMSGEQAQFLLDTLVRQGKIDRAVALALAIYSGRRKSELVRFRMSDFDDDKLVCGGALYKSAPIQTKGRALGKYIPCYTLAKKFQPYLELWKKYREKNGIESEWLLPDPSNPDKQLNTATLNFWAISFTKILGMDFYWHCCRHFYTTYLVKAGIPDSVIAEIVGWSDVSLVKVYTDIDADEQIGAFFKDGEISVQKNGIF